MVKKVSTFQGKPKPYGKSGHYYEPKRHSLQAKGFKTGRHQGWPLKEPAIYPLARDYGIKYIDNSNHDFTKIRYADTGIKLTREQLEELSSQIQSSLRQAGYESYSGITPKGKFMVANIRLIPLKKGYNISPYTGRRGRILNWDNWVEVNGIINNVLDKWQVSANVSSLKGRFKIREGTRVYTEDDWENLMWENVGSVISPIPRKEAWSPE